MTIWMQCGGRRNLGTYQGGVWRVVEAQHRNSTRKLVDSDAEQQLLEALIDRVKPPAPPGPATDGLHYLLITPFRHPPLRHGSRFATRMEGSLFYASELLETAFAEMAYYRLLFLEGTAAVLEPVSLELTAFAADVRSRMAVDLTRLAFRAHARALSSRTRYEVPQALGQQMRAEGVEVVRYASARDAAGRPNVALFSPRAFARKTPRKTQTWRCITTRERVEASRVDWFEHGHFLFPRSQFEVGGVLPRPAL